MRKVIFAPKSPPYFAKGELRKRPYTDQIVIHHTGGAVGQDLSANQIHQIHQGTGWAGIGYHFVIRKDGTIENGRPADTIGAHAYGENAHTIGIHVNGNFEGEEPTDSQIESLALLIAKLCLDYNLTINANNVVGHRDLMATACPGENLYNILATVRGKAVWYQLN